jgi:hypothetical protein
MIALLVAGSRDMPPEPVRRELDRIAAQRTIALIIQGGCRGADTHAARWARERDIPVEAHPAMWHRYGYRAGPLRNAAMLDALLRHGHRGALVVRYADSRGSADMLRRLRAAGIPTVDVIASLSASDGVDSVVRRGIPGMGGTR